MKGAIVTVLDIVADCMRRTLATASPDVSAVDASIANEKTMRDTVDRINELIEGAKHGNRQ